MFKVVRCIFHHMLLFNRLTNTANRPNNRITCPYIWKESSSIFWSIGLNGIIKGSLLQTKGGFMPIIYYPSLWGKSIRKISPIYQRRTLRLLMKTRATVQPISKTEMYPSKELGGARHHRHSVGFLSSRWITGNSHKFVFIHQLSPWLEPYKRLFKLARNRDT